MEEFIEDITCLGEDVNVENESNNLYVNRVNEVVDDLMGFVVHGEEEAFDLYNNYAIRIGFSVRRCKKRYNIDKKIRQREYRCSKAGYNVDDKLLSNKQRHTLETRSGCEAMIRFSVDDDGKWIVTKFVSVHNHELALPSEVYMLRSNRNLTTAKSNVIDSMVDSGISTINTFSYMSKEVGGDEYLGFTKKDCYNYVNQRNMSLIEAGDSQSLINHFKQRQAEDVMFFYTVQVDEQNRMTNFFWRDDRSRIDYDCFGDVIVFDTTYRTNKYNLICAPFVGVNHHWQNVMFGCAFLLDETTTSFIWLFKSFLESMGGREPQSIFTDQDQAMANAISVVFSNTHHRLCLWHISQNAPSHLGNLNSNSEFRRLFYKMLQRCETEVEFEEVWNKLCESFAEVRSHRWLNKLYSIRQKWCKGLNKDVFSAGILSSQRSEATNRVLNTIASKTTSLTKFVHKFEEIVRCWRCSESQEDFRCKQRLPPRVVKTSGLLNHAATVYTCEIFKQFEKQFWNVMATNWTEVASSNDVHTYEIKGEEVGSRISIVCFNASSMTISCSCKKLESKGFICCHILRVLSINNVTKIPESCILHRWTKDAKKRKYECWQREVASTDTVETNSMFRNEMMRFAYNIVTQSQDDEVCRQLCRDNFSKLNIEVESLLSTLNVGETSDIAEDRTNFVKGKQKITETEPVLNPECVKPKGISNARLRGHFRTRIVKGKTNLSKAGSVKGRKKVNAESNAYNTFSAIPPNPNIQFITTPQMITPGFHYAQHPQLMLPNLQYQVPTSMIPLPITFPNQIAPESIGNSNMLFTHMMQHFNSMKD